MCYALHVHVVLHVRTCIVHVHVSVASADARMCTNGDNETNQNEVHFHKAFSQKASSINSQSLVTTTITVDQTARYLVVMRLKLQSDLLSVSYKQTNKWCVFASNARRFCLAFHLAFK